MKILEILSCAFIYRNQIVYCDIFKLIKMEYSCAICYQRFPTTSLQHLEEFCDHVKLCPVKSDNFMVYRYTCCFCKHVVKTKRSFKEHILHCKATEIPSSSQKSLRILNTLKKSTKERLEGNFENKFSKL